MDIVKRLRDPGVFVDRNEVADEIERLRKQMLAPSVAWNGFLVSGMQKSIDEVSRLIELEIALMRYLNEREH